MKKREVIIILLILAVLVPLFSEEGSSLYDSGLEKYKQKQNEESLKEFKEFREQNPGHKRADDALWYMGRLYERLGRDSEAESTFREVLTLHDSNRLAEAAYDLSQILYSQKN